MFSIAITTIVDSERVSVLASLGPEVLPFSRHRSVRTVVINVRSAPDQPAATFGPSVHSPHIYQNSRIQNNSHSPGAFRSLRCPFLALRPQFANPSRASLTQLWMLFIAPSRNL